MKYLAIFAFLAASAAALPTTSTHSNYVVHEKRTGIKRARSYSQIDRRGVLPISIGLKQQNLEKGHDYLMDVSHPDSENYGKHWSSQQIAETFSAHPDSIDAVLSWLDTSGISIERVSVVKGKHWIKFDASISEAESLLQTEYKVYDHPQTGEPVLGCDEYSIPYSLTDHVDFVTPTVHGQPSRIPLKKREVTEAERDNAVNPREVKRINSNDLSSCTNFTTIDCIRFLYNIPVGTTAGAASGATYGLVELFSTFNQSDLNNFYADVNGDHPPKGTAPITISVDNGSLDVDSGIDLLDEATLDLEVAIPLIYPQQVIVYELGTPTSQGTFGNFLDAIDADICGINNDPTSTDCGNITSADVLSFSYTGDEDAHPRHNIRQCYEYLKLGLQGITVLIASGDNGVQSVDSDDSCTRFQRTFPASCPYITAVGATALTSVNPPTLPEVAANRFGSGGGFSDLFPLPSYQSDAVSSYLTNFPPPYNGSQYNNSGNARGYPDISANGQVFASAVRGTFEEEVGTSMAAPLVGSIFNLINQQRLLAKKSTLGFLNPVLYANPIAFTDIVSGFSNDVDKNVTAGCGTKGFEVQEGWDPVTGLGTPDYEKLLKVFMALN